MTAAAPPADWSSPKSATHPIHKTPKWSPPPPEQFLVPETPEACTFWTLLQPHKRLHSHDKMYISGLPPKLVGTERTREESYCQIQQTHHILQAFLSFPFLSFLHKGREKSQSNRCFKHWT
jgi:hypothetical protein